MLLPVAALSLGTIRCGDAPSVHASIHSQQPWYEQLVTKDSLQCNHTFNFYNYFLPHIECASKQRVGHCMDGAKWLCDVPRLAAKAVSA
jgi:hypothetical protein